MISVLPAVGAGFLASSAGAMQEIYGVGVTNQRQVR